MSLTIIDDKKIKHNKKKLDTFLENFLPNRKDFTIDCEAIGVDFVNPETIITIRHRKPAAQSIYYAETFKERDENAYFFGLARENVIATSSYLDRGSQIKPILVAILNTEDSSKSNLVFAEDSEEYNNVLLLRIDCSELKDLELKVLMNKNKISKFNEGKAYINFGPIGDFNTLKNIRNFISNVEFLNDDSVYKKLVKVSIPEEYKTLSVKPDSEVVKDRFYNYDKINSLNKNNVDVIDSNKSISDDSNKLISDDSNRIIEKEEDLSDSTENFVGEEDLNKFIEDNSGIEALNNELLEVEEDDSILEYSYYSIDDDEIFLEMCIEKKDYFTIMDFFNNLFKLSLELDYVEVLDTEDNYLNLTFNFLILNKLNIRIIKNALDKNGFEEK